MNLLFCMRATLVIGGKLRCQAKRHAAETGQTLAGLIERVLRETLARGLGRRCSWPKAH